jgi:hypothetical protein
MGRCLFGILHPVSSSSFCIPHSICILSPAKHSHVAKLSLSGINAPHPLMSHTLCSPSTQHSAMMMMLTRVNSGNL